MSDENTKGVPDFWLTIFKNVEMLADMIQVSVWNVFCQHQIWNQISFCYSSTWKRLFLEQTYILLAFIIIFVSHCEISKLCWPITAKFCIMICSRLNFL